MLLRVFRYGGSSFVCLFNSDDKIYIYINVLQRSTPTSSPALTFCTHSRRSKLEYNQMRTIKIKLKYKIKMKLRHDIKEN